MPIPTISSPAVGMGVEQLTNLMFQYYRELQYLLGGQLDSTNVREITTDKITAGEAWVTTLVAETITADYINALEVVAGSVSADDITAGTITGVTINVNTVLTVGYDIAMQLGSSATSTIYFGGTTWANAYSVIRADPANGNMVFGFPHETGGAHITIGDSGTLYFDAYIGFDSGSSIDFTNATLVNFPGYTHNHDSLYAPLSHTHDDRYYTKDEADARFAPI